MDGFEIECDNPFTEKICTDNKTMLTELLSVYEHRIISENEVTITGKSGGGPREPVSLDSL